MQSLLTKEFIDVVKEHKFLSRLTNFIMLSVIIGA